MARFKKPEEVKVLEERSDAGAGIIHPTGADDDAPMDRRPTAAPTSIDTAGPTGRPGDPLAVKTVDVVRVAHEGRVATREQQAETFVVQRITVNDEPQRISGANPHRTSITLMELSGNSVFIAPTRELCTLSTAFPISGSLNPITWHHTDEVWCISATVGTPRTVAVLAEYRQLDR